MKNSNSKNFVSVDDVKSKLGIDLIAQLGNDLQANLFIARQQRKILNHITEYAYAGNAQVDLYLKCQDSKEIIIEAIIEQIDFVAYNQFVEPSRLMQRDKSDNAIALAPEAHRILLNSGLLYTGRS